MDMDKVEKIFIYVFIGLVLSPFVIGSLNLLRIYLRDKIKEKKK